MAYPGRKRYVVVYDGCFTHLEEVPADHEDAMPFGEAQREALNFLRSQRDNYRIAITQMNQLTTKDV